MHRQCFHVVVVLLLDGREHLLRLRRRVCDKDFQERQYLDHRSGEENLLRPLVVELMGERQSRGVPNPAEDQTWVVVVRQFRSDVAVVGGEFQKDYYLDEERRAVPLVDGVCQKDYYRDAERGGEELIPRAMSQSLDWVGVMCRMNLALASRGVHPRRRHVRVLHWSVRQDRARVQPEVRLQPREISSLAQTLPRPSSSRPS